jgi:hypothetical protein
MAAPRVAERDLACLERGTHESTRRSRRSSRQGKLRRSSKIDNVQPRDDDPLR